MVARKWAKCDSPAAALNVGATGAAGAGGAAGTRDSTLFAERPAHYFARALFFAQ